MKVTLNQIILVCILLKGLTYVLILAEQNTWLLLPFVLAFLLLNLFSLVKVKPKYIYIRLRFQAHDSLG